MYIQFGIWLYNLEMWFMDIVFFIMYVIYFILYFGCSNIGILYVYDVECLYFFYF